ncbi:MAG: hypothetical protein HRT88_22180, partial [Lentisphaeraceae bacterium]|nr:hypothetical protein [Lentisphaeraceae bacterium]
DIELFSKGLAKMQFPSFNSDQSKAIMIQEDKDFRPVPVIFDFTTNKMKRISERQGLWLNPVWH